MSRAVEVQNLRIGTTVGAEVRAGRDTAVTVGKALGYLQANVVILPAD